MKSVLTTDTAENCQKKIDEAGQRAWRSTPATLSRAADRGPQHDQENGRRPARHGHAGQVTALGTPTTPKRTLWRTTRTATRAVPSSSNVPGVHPVASAEQGSAGQRRDGRREPFAFAARTVLSFSRLFFLSKKTFPYRKDCRKNYLLLRISVHKILTGIVLSIRGWPFSSLVDRSLSSQRLKRRTVKVEQ